MKVERASIALRVLSLGARRRARVMARDGAYGRAIDVCDVEDDAGATRARLYRSTRVGVADARAPPLARVLGEKVRFPSRASRALRAAGARARWTCDDHGCRVEGLDGAEASGRGARRSLEAYVKLAIWDGLLARTEATRAAGDVEVFAPRNGTNVMWHRDGYLPGEYIGHALVDVGEGGEDVGGRWFEHALADDDASDASTTDAEHVVDFGNQSIATRLVCAENFVPIDASGGALVVFEDAVAFHRSPKTASRALERESRAIARFNFSAYDACGRTVRLASPPNATWRPFDDRDRIAELSGVDVARYVADPR